MTPQTSYDVANCTAEYSFDGATWFCFKLGQHEVHADYMGLWLESRKRKHFEDTVILKLKNLESLIEGLCLTNSLKK